MYMYLSALSWCLRSSTKPNFHHSQVGNSHITASRLLLLEQDGRYIPPPPPTLPLYRHLITPPSIRTIPRNLPSNLLSKPLSRLSTQPCRLGRRQDGLDPHTDLIRITILPHPIQHLVHIRLRLERARRAQHGGHLARVLHGGHADLAVEGRGDVELLQDGELRGGGQDEQAVALGGRGLEQGEEGLDDGVGEAQADGVPFD